MEEFLSKREKSWVLRISAQYAEELTPRVLLEVEASGLKEQVSPTVEQNVAGSGRLGRGSVKRISLKSGSEAVFRHCLRGGMVQRFSSETFLRRPFLSLEQLRPFAELRILDVLLKEGVPVPKPVAAGVRLLAGGLCYRGFLVTEAIAETDNLLRLSSSAAGEAKEEELCAELAYRAGKEARKMHALGVFHPDLHLGNVLFDRQGRVYLIDFDKASDSLPASKSGTALQRMKQRWLRSLNRHFADSSGFRNRLEEAFVQGLME